MTRQEFLNICLCSFGTSPDYPFNEDLETAVLRHSDNRKWYAIVMRVSRRKFGLDSNEIIDVVNLKLHWVSVLLPDAPENVVTLLTNASFVATKGKIKPKRNI